MRRHATRGTAKRRCNCRWTPATGDPAPQAVASTPFHPSRQPLCAPVADTRHSARRPPTPEGQKSAAPRPDHPRQTLTKPGLSLPVHYRFPHLEERINGACSPASSDNSPTTGNNARAFVQFCWKRSAKRRASGAPATVPPAGSISAGRRAAASSILVTWTTSPSRTTSSNPRPGLESAPQSLAPRPLCAALSNACFCWQEACEAGARICLITNSLPRIRASYSTPVVRDPG